MGRAIANYLRTHRRKSALTQSEVAFLLGLRSGQTVSRHERLDRRPSLEIIFAYQVLFDALPHELCPGLYVEVEKTIKRRIHALIRRLGKEQEPLQGLALRKYEILAQAVERIGEGPRAGL